MIFEKFKEAILKEEFDVPNRVFDTFIPAFKAERANKKYKPLEETREGQLKILKDAEDGVEDALNYLYLRYLKLIKKVYNHYYIGPNKQAGAYKREEPYVKDFLSIAYPFWDKNEPTNPYKTFNPSVYSETTNIINNFGYWYMRYLENETMKLLRKQKLYGLSGAEGYGLRRASDNEEDVDSEGNLSFESMEGRLSNDAEIATEDFSSQVVDSIVISNIYNSYRKWLEEEKGKNYLLVFDMVLEGHSFSDIAKIYGTKYPRLIKDMWSRIKKWLLERYPELERDYMAMKKAEENEE